VSAHAGIAATGRARLASALGGDAALGALGASALYELWRYQAAARLRGPSEARAQAILQRWSRRACRWLGLDVRVYGISAPVRQVYVANHRSYLDIPLLSAVLGTTFVSRADVASWPVVGPAARCVGVVFVERDDPRSRIRAARALHRGVRNASITVFPEGTTTGARLPGAFHPGLFRLLHRLGCPVVPVTIRYGDRRAYWIEDVTLARHLRTRVLAGGRLTAAVHVGEPLDPRVHRDAAELISAAHAAVCAPIEQLGELAQAAS
jgi:1-acyl-sn-glycerol-3-phosphate acyltransferase